LELSSSRIDSCEIAGEDGVQLVEPRLQLSRGFLRFEVFPLLEVFSLCFDVRLQRLVLFLEVADPRDDLLQLRVVGR